MVFCTQCGTEVSEIHKFCASCGARVVSDGSEAKKYPEAKEGEGPIQTRQPLKRHVQDSVDRKTLFDDGMLVLTSKNLILYSSDEGSELLRIPVESIYSCGYSMLKKGLAVRHAVNRESGLLEYAEKREELDARRGEIGEKIRDAGEEELDDLKERLRQLEQQYKEADKEARLPESDAEAGDAAEGKTADIKKEIFRLPPDYEAKSGRTVKDECHIWEYAVRRRIAGIPQIKITTMPYDAVLTINDTVVGTTPITTDKPLLSESVLEGRYSLEIHKEGYDAVQFFVPTSIHKPYQRHEDLSARKIPNANLDRLVREMRGKVAPRTIDMSLYSILLEVQGRHEMLVLTDTEVIVMSKNRKTHLFDIPYGAISSARYDRGFLRGSGAVKVTYDEIDFKDVLFEFWVDDKEGKMSSSEVKRQSENLVRMLNARRNESMLYDIPQHTRPPEYFVLTQQDIDDNFERFEPFEFEKLVGKLFAKKGYKTEITQERGDFGADVIAKSAKETIVIQVKHWKASVGGPDVHKTLGSMHTHNADLAMVVTTSDFTEQAREIQKRGSPVELWNGSRLREEFKRHMIES